MNAQKNGAPWSPFAVKGVLSVIDSLAISATSVSFQGSSAVRLDSLSIKIACLANGTYKLAGSQAYYVTFNQNGTLTGYQLDPSFNNVINITGFQEIDNPATMNPNVIKVTGTFNMKFIDPKNSGGISFSNGNFFVVVPR